MKNLTVMCKKCGEPARYHVRDSVVSAEHHGETEAARVLFFHVGNVPPARTLTFFNGSEFAVMETDTPFGNIKSKTWHPLKGTEEIHVVSSAFPRFTGTS